MVTPLLQTKLYIPSARPEMAPRVRCVGEAVNEDHWRAAALIGEAPGLLASGDL